MFALRGIANSIIKIRGTISGAVLSASAASIAALVFCKTFYSEALLLLPVIAHENICLKNDKSLPGDRVSADEAQKVRA